LKNAGSEMLGSRGLKIHLDDNRTLKRARKRFLLNSAPKSAHHKFYVLENMRPSKKSGRHQSSFAIIDRRGLKAISKEIALAFFCGSIRTVMEYDRKDASWIFAKPRDGENPIKERWIACDALSYSGSGVHTFPQGAITVPKLDAILRAKMTRN
jgi:hypothetical protein